MTVHGSTAGSDSTGKMIDKLGSKYTLNKVKGSITDQGEKADGDDCR